MMLHQPLTEELIQILKTRPDLGRALEESVIAAQRPGIGNLQQYFEFLNRMSTRIPVIRNLQSDFLEFHYLLGFSANNCLMKDPLFTAWIKKFTVECGSYLDSIESSAELHKFTEDPNYRVGDYFAGPSGWLTYNQFFAREVKPGKRPIDNQHVKSVIVSPVDSVFQGPWTITGDAVITAKGMPSMLTRLLEDSEYQERFDGGSFTQSYLDIYDYHRFHSPVEGRVLEARKIPGVFSMNVLRAEDGSLEAVEGEASQFRQDRGLIVIETPYGIVGMVPIGVSKDSSVNLTVEPGTYLFKGQECGFFAYGGSDVLLLFEKDKVRIGLEPGRKYLQGNKIGVFS